MIRQKKDAAKVLNGRTSLVQILCVESCTIDVSMPTVATGAEVEAPNKDR